MVCGTIVPNNKQRERKKESERENSLITCVRPQPFEVGTVYSYTSISRMLNDRDVNFFFVETGHFSLYKESSDVSSPASNLHVL